MREVVTGMRERAAGMREGGDGSGESDGSGGGAAWAIGAGHDWCAGSLRSTPHLTSPLEGGRDELGVPPFQGGGMNFGRCARACG